LKVSDGQLYLSTGSAGFRGVSTVGAGLPTEAGNTTTLLSGFESNPGTPSSYDFWFSDANTVYVADDRSLANGGGVQKWTQSEGVWSLAYTLSTNLTGGLRGLTGSVDGGSVTLYATTTQTSANRIVSVIDTGASSGFSELATAPTNTVFRGIVFAEVGGEGTPGDFDGDGDVDGRDFLVWQRGETTPALDPGLLAEWQNAYNGGAVAAVGSVPEPTTLALLALALVPVACGRKR
jgi:hypothetical protein